MNGDKKGILVTKSTFLHNTKIASSKTAKDEIKNAKRDKKTLMLGALFLLKCFIACYAMRRFTRI